MSVKVLYVEDEPSLAQIVSESLSSRGFNIIVAKDGQEGIELINKQSFDIAVLDIMLPKLDGYSLAKSIIQVHPKMPIIFLSAKTQTEDVIKGFHVGAKDYMRKPFSMEELIVRMNNLLDRSSSSENDEEEYELGRYSFYPRKYELYQEGLKIDLSERESRILTMLCQHLNSTVQRKKILLEIWGDDSYYNSRNLDVYINKLRKILGQDQSLEIMTLKGVGYIFKTNS